MRGYWGFYPISMRQELNTTETPKLYPTMLRPLEMSRRLNSALIAWSGAWRTCNLTRANVNVLRRLGLNHILPPKAGLVWNKAGLGRNSSRRFSILQCDGNNLALQVPCCFFPSSYSCNGQRIMRIVWKMGIYYKDTAAWIWNQDT